MSKNAFNDFLSNVGEGLSGAGSPNMRSYQHATKLYVEGSYARAPKLNHLYFVTFNINDGVIRDPGWLEQGVREVGLLVKSSGLPKFKIKIEEMNQYNRKTQVQTKLTYDPLSMEFHDDNSEITNGLWKNYYRYYYTDSTYGGKDDTAQTQASRISLGQKLFGGLFNPGSKRIKNRETSLVPAAFSDNKYSKDTYPYGLDNLQTVPFFKSIDIFVLHQQKFTQITLINPKITSWEHDDVGQGDNSKPMRNKMSVVYESVLYNDGRIGKGSNSGVFAEAYYDTEPSPLSVAGKGSLSLLGSGGIIAGVEDVFGADGDIAQGNYWQAILKISSLSKNYEKISNEQVSDEAVGLLSTSLGIAAASKRGEILENLSSQYSNGAFGIYTNQYSKNNLEEIPTTPRFISLVQLDVTADEIATAQYNEALRAERARRAAGGQGDDADGVDNAELKVKEAYAAERVAVLNKIQSDKDSSSVLLSTLIKNRDAAQENIRTIQEGLPTNAELQNIEQTKNYQYYIAIGLNPADARAKATLDLPALIAFRNSGLELISLNQAVYDGNQDLINETKSRQILLDNLVVKVNSDIYNNDLVANETIAQRYDNAIYSIQQRAGGLALTLYQSESNQLSSYVDSAIKIDSQLNSALKQQKDLENMYTADFNEWEYLNKNAIEKFRSQVVPTPVVIIEPALNQASNKVTNTITQMIQAGASKLLTWFEKSDNAKLVDSKTGVVENAAAGTEKIVGKIISKKIEPYVLSAKDLADDARTAALDLAEQRQYEASERADGRRFAGGSTPEDRAIMTEGFAIAAAYDPLANYTTDEIQAAFQDEYQSNLLIAKKLEADNDRRLIEAAAQTINQNLSKEIEELNQRKKAYTVLEQELNQKKAARAVLEQELETLRQEIINLGNAPENQALVTAKQNEKALKEVAEVAVAEIIVDQEETQARNQLERVRLELQIANEEAKKKSLQILIDEKAATANAAATPPVTVITVEKSTISTPTKVVATIVYDTGQPDLKYGLSRVIQKGEFILGAIGPSLPNQGLSVDIKEDFTIKVDNNFDKWPKWAWQQLYFIAANNPALIQGAITTGKVATYKKGSTDISFQPAPTIQKTIVKEFPVGTSPTDAIAKASVGIQRKDILSQTAVTK